MAIPAPLPLFLFNGCKASFTRDVNSFGKIRSFLKLIDFLGKLNKFNQKKSTAQ